MIAFRRIFLLAASSFALLLSAACGPTPRQRTATVLDDVESYINDRPDSALAVLRGVDSTALTTRALRARYSLLHTMALDKCYIDLQTDSILAPASSWYMRHGSPDEKLRTLYYQGRIQFNAKDYERAGLSFLQAHNLFDRATDLRYKGLLCQHLANVYNQTYNYSEALTYTKQAYAIFREGKYPDQIICTQHRLAEEYINNLMWDDAKKTFDSLMVQTLPPAIKQDALCGWALYYAVSPEEDYARTVDIYASVLSEFGTLHSLNDWGCYAYSLARTGRKTESDRVFDSLSNINAPNKDLFYFGWRSRAEKCAGNYPLAWDFFSTASDSSNLKLRKALEQSVIKAQRNFLESENRSTKQQAKISFFVLISVLLSALLIGSILYLCYKNHLDSVREERDRMFQLSELARQNLHIAETEVSSLRGELIQQKKDQFIKLGRLCEEYFSLGKKSDRDALLLSRITGIVNELSLEAPDINSFENRVNKTYDNIMLHFRSDFPGLSENEYRFVCYVFAGFDTVTIMLLLNYKSKDVIYSKKNRIRKEIRSSSSLYKEDYIRLFG